MSEITQTEFQRIMNAQATVQDVLSKLSEKGKLTLCIQLAELIEPQLQKVKHLMEQDLKTHSMAKQWAAQTGLDVKKKELP